MTTDELIAKLEAAREGSLDLDGRIYCAVNGLVFRSTGKDGRIHFEPDKDGSHTMLTPHPYTTSLDEAVTLVPNGWEYGIGTHPANEIFNPGGAQAYCMDSFGNDTGPRGYAHAEASTAPLALCIAALKARQDAPAPRSDWSPPDRINKEGDPIAEGRRATEDLGPAGTNA